MAAVIENEWIHAVYIYHLPYGYTYCTFHKSNWLFLKELSDFEAVNWFLLEEKEYNIRERKSFDLVLASLK